MAYDWLNVEKTDLSLPDIYYPTDSIETARRDGRLSEWDTSSPTEYTFILHLPPGMWAVPVQELSWADDAVVNDTGQTVLQTYTLDIPAGEDVWTYLDMGIIPGHPAPTEEVVISDRAVVFIEESLWTEPFTSAVIVKDDMEENITIVTPDHDWEAQRRWQYNNTFYDISVSEGLNLTINTDDTPDELISYERGLWIWQEGYPDIGITETSIALIVDSESIEEPKAGDDGYYGIWLRSRNNKYLWVDLTDWSTPALLPQISPEWDMSYTYVNLGSGKQTLDLRQFDSWFSGGIKEVWVDTYTKLAGDYPG